ncbi:MAG: hypothetical protein C5B50_14655 [Verrucomicrobia bacterium]|nr:MAG: hypothetical protein C5B50_14655 [Verrucomicrobiota bacterium]
MNRNIGPFIAINLLALSTVMNSDGQGFINLDFERGVTSSNTIPGWTAYVNGSPTTVLSNNIALNGGAVCLLGTNGGFQQIQGAWFAYLQGQTVGFPNTASIGQTGMVPITAESLIFWGSVGAGDVTFNGQTLPLVVLGTAPNYKIYGANISGFAGGVGQLLFTSYSSQVGGQWDSVDNIQFSTQFIPEPSAVALLSVGVLSFGLIRTRLQNGTGLGRNFRND